MLNTFVKSFLGVAVLAGVSQAATSWTVPSGSGSYIDYSQGQTDNGLFTDSSPIVGGDTSDKFLFFPNNFTASEQGPTMVSDTLSFVVTAKPGQRLSRISAGLNGDYSTLGPAYVFGESTLTLTNLNTSVVLNQLLTFDPTMPTTSSEGTFTGFGEIALPAGWTNAKVDLTASLAVGPGLAAGSQSLIQQQLYAAQMQLKGANVDIQTAPVPLPGALAAAPFAMGIAWYTRRRMSK